MFGFKKKKPKKQKKKPAKKASAKKKAFGGYGVSFAGQNMTLEKLFGKEKITPSQMTKKLWNFIKSKKLGKK